MGKARLGGFLVVLAKIAGGVEKLLGNDRSFQGDFVARVEDSFSTGSWATVVVQHVVKRFAGGFQAGVPSAKQGAHVGWNQGVGQAVECAFVLNISQVQGAGGVQINDTSVGSMGAD